MDFTLGQTLYAVTKTGNVKTWRAEVIGDDVEAIINIFTQAKLGGKEVVRQRFVTEGKNIGKSNETTPHQQAISETESRYRKQFDKGYQTEIPTDTSKANTNALGFPKPMLAHPIDKVKNVEFPAYLQSKLDGHRAIVTKQEGEMVMYSRSGKRIDTMGHILDFLVDRMKDGEFLDGELYLHDTALQKITSYIKRQQPDSMRITYWVYDIMIDEPFAERTERVREIARGHLTSAQANSNETPVRYLPTPRVTSMEQTMEFFGTYLECGYEGAILRTPDNGYEAGFRSRTLLKIKPFDDNEFEIIDVIEAEGHHVNDVSLKTCKFICQMDDGKTFDVFAPGNVREKAAIWDSRVDYIGQMVTVKHSGYTVEGKPWHPVALRIRDDI